MSESVTETNRAQEAQQAASGQDILEQLLKPEVQESLTTLVEHLPKLTEIVTLMSKSYDFAQSVATDEVLKKDTVGAIQELLEPVKGTVKGIAQNVVEAKGRADQSNEVIGLFGVLRMMKDPQAQKMFRFMNAYLEVSAQRNSEK